MGNLCYLETDVCGILWWVHCGGVLGSLEFVVPVVAIGVKFPIRCWSEFGEGDDLSI